MQWRYGFVTDEEGVKVFDTFNPTTPRFVASVPLKHAEGLYVARTYLYVANGADGLAIINIKDPENPAKLDDITAGGQLNDVRDVQIGSINASMYALVADGKNGMRVLQLISPENVPGHMGFSPLPQPKLIAGYPTKGIAVTVSRGLDRDRVVDESGNQTVVFGRRGSRPFNLDEMTAFFRHSSPGQEDKKDAPHRGPVYKVADVRVDKKDGVLKTGNQPLAPTEQFKLPASAIDEKEQIPRDRRRRRAPEGLNR
jgi:hypothetical protein